ncbi:iron-containing alcohol dehydrogenase [Salinarimonas ramus]|uniref:Alcohol dehydrogenase 2 n=1 Tax=Salinarimonas ramus TaxID=690164 RepID=A0A917V389_9HYPH|nr:iron-containing alcohol dehydrogenase [Salinarimonas ramus]GGK33612.1 alcohol dehydrogenase [Salinarimonas ramus]
MTPFTFATTPSIVFGAGAIGRLGELAAGRLGPRVLLVTDAGLVEAGLVAPAIAALEAAGTSVALYTGVVADPPESVVEAAAAAVRAHSASGVVGLGGGSSLDVAKVAALLAGSGEALARAYGVGNAEGPRLPLVLVPTTAGTGSEVTPISIVTTGAHTKMGVVSPLLLPDVAILDPDLTLGLPAPVTAATGVDAMVHAIEAFTSASPNANPVSKALAREALRMLGGAIVAACRDGSDREARGAMLMGSMLAGQAFANSPVAAVHALAYPLGGHFGIPHGLSNALVLTQVMRFNLPAAREAYATLAPDVFPGCPKDAEALIARLEALCAEIGLARRLRDVGVPEDALPRLAEDAMKQTRLLVNNPREVTLADTLAIYEAAW